MIRMQMRESIPVLAGCAATTVASISLGLLLFRLLRISLKGIEHLALAFVSGSALLSLSVFALAAAGLARTGFYVAILLAAAGSAARLEILRFPRGDRAAIDWRLRAIAV